MPGNGEIIERAINDFQKVQKRMLNAREENDTKTYADLRDGVTKNQSQGIDIESKACYH